MSSLCNDSEKEKGSQAGGARSAPPAVDVFLAVIAVASAIVHGQRPLVYGWVRGMRVHAVTAASSCIGMVNVSGAWLTGGLSSADEIIATTPRDNHVRAPRTLRWPSWS